MNRFLVLGLPGAVLGALLGVLIIVAQMTGIAGTPGDYATPFEGPLAFKKIELKQVAETRQMPDGRLYTFRKFVSHWVPVSNGFRINCWEELILQLARGEKLQQSIDLLSAIPTDREKGEVILSLLPIMECCVNIEQGMKWSKQPPPLLPPEQLHELEREYLVPGTAAPKSKPADAGLHFRIDVAKRCAEVLQQIIAIATHIDDLVVRSTVLAGVADFQLSQGERWAQASIDETLLAAKEAGTAAQRRKPYYVWLWPIILGGVGFVVCNLSKPLLEAVGTTIAVGVVSKTGNKRLMEILRD